MPTEGQVVGREARAKHQPQTRRAGAPRTGRPTAAAPLTLRLRLECRACRGSVYVPAQGQDLQGSRCRRPAHSSAAGALAPARSPSDSQVTWYPHCSFGSLLTLLEVAARPQPGWPPLGLPQAPACISVSSTRGGGSTTSEHLKPCSAVPRHFPGIRTPRARPSPELRHSWVTPDAVPARAPLAHTSRTPRAAQLAAGRGPQPWSSAGRQHGPWKTL